MKTFYCKNWPFIPVLIDDEDWDCVTKYNWRVHRNDGSILAWINGTNIYLNRFILNVTDPKIKVDHKDRNIFNNQKENLRKCDNQQNSCNKGPQIYKKYKGTSFVNSKNRWKAQIMYCYRQIHIGYFDSEEEAARAYDKKAKKIHGEFAYLNFPKE